MKIFSYEIHRKKQLDILENIRPLICIHRHGRNSKGEPFSKRVIVIYGGR